MNGISPVIWCHRERTVLLVVLALLGGSVVSAPLVPKVRVKGWEEGSALLDRWQTVQGVGRSSTEVFPRASVIEILQGNDANGPKVRYVDSGAAEYWLAVEMPDGTRHAEMSIGSYEYWFLSDTLGNGKIPGTSDFATSLHKIRPDADFVRRNFSSWRRLADDVRDSKKYNSVRLEKIERGFEIWLFDPGSGVLSIIDTFTTEGVLIGRVRFSDFRERDGALEACETTIGEGPHRVTLHATEITNRAKLPPRFFFPPPAQMAAWRKSEDIIEKYVKACGGLLALAQIVSRVTNVSGENTSAGAKFELTISQKAPTLYLVETNVPGLGKSWQGYDGELGWEYSELQGFRSMHGSEAELLRRNGMLNVENFATLFPLRKVLGVKEVNGRRTVAVELASRLGKAGTHYFDVESGQLLRVEAILALGSEGNLPVTIDFSDFRTVDGVVLPFKSVMTNPALRIETVVHSIAQNVPLDDAIFHVRRE